MINFSPHGEVFYSEASRGLALLDSLLWLQVNNIWDFFLTAVKFWSLFLEGFSVVHCAKLECIFRLLNYLLPCKFQNQTTNSPYMYLLVTFLFIPVLEICYNEMRCWNVTYWSFAFFLFRNLLLKSSAMSGFLCCQLNFWWIEWQQRKLWETTEPAGKLYCSKAFYLIIIHVCCIKLTF